MLTLINPAVLEVDGLIQRAWSSYEIDSDLMIPADAWQFTLERAVPTLPSAVRPGAAVRVRINDETVMSGRVDTVDHAIDKGRHTFTINGRDLAGQLVDCSADLTGFKTLSLSEILRSMLKPYGVPYRIEAAKTRIRDTVRIDPGESVWDVISRACEANGLWQWFEPDGTLVVGAPNPKTPTVATLALTRSGIGCNVESLAVTRSLNERFSRITVLAQSSGGTQEPGHYDLQGFSDDGGVGYHRPRVIVSGDCENVAAARALARKAMVDAQLNSHTITVTVPGHTAGTGVLWQPRQRVSLLSEPHGIDGAFFIMGRKFLLSRTGGMTTELRLKQDGVWTVSPFKHKAKKGGKAAGQVLDLPAYPEAPQ